MGVIGGIRHHAHHRISLYSPENQILYVDCSHYEPDGFCSVCLNDIYRVEHIRKNEYWLYAIDEYGFKLKIKFAE